MKFILLVLLAATSSAELAPLHKVKEMANDRYIIKMKDSADVSQLTNDPTFVMLGGRTLYQYQKVLRGFSANLSKEALNYVLASELVEYVEEDGVMKPASYLPPTWGLDRLNQHGFCLDGDETFKTGNGGFGANVFVIGSGVSPTDPEFEGRAIVAIDYVGDDWNGTDCEGHDSQTSGIIGSRSYGVAKNTLIHGVRIMDCFQNVYLSDAIIACDYVAGATEDKKVALLALTAPFISSSLNDAVQRMIDADVAVALAAGNQGDDACNFSPGSAPNALTVGASDQYDARVPNTNYGPCVDIFAPGYEVLTTDIFERRIRYSGTSIAAAHAAGVMALMRVAYPCLSGQEIIDVIKARADSGLMANTIGSGDKFIYCY